MKVILILFQLFNLSASNDSGSDFTTMLTVINKELQKAKDHQEPSLLYDQYVLYELTLGLTKPDENDSMLSPIEMKFFDINSLTPKRIIDADDYGLVTISEREYMDCRKNNKFWSCFSENYADKKGIVSVTIPVFDGDKGFFMYSYFDTSGHGRVVKIWCKKKENSEWQVIKRTNVLET